jgi:hypothetical protein
VLIPFVDPWSDAMSTKESERNSSAQQILDSKLPTATHCQTIHTIQQSYMKYPNY